MTSPYKHPQYIECACGTFSHLIRLSLDDYEHSPEVNIICETRMSHFLPWYRRIVEAFKFIFKMENECCQYEETIIEPESFPKIRALMDEAERLSQAKCDKLAKEILVEQEKTNE